MQTKYNNTKRCSICTLDCYQTPDGHWEHCPVKVHGTKSMSVSEVEEIADKLQAVTDTHVAIPSKG